MAIARDDPSVVPDLWFRNDEVYGDLEPSDPQRREKSEGNGGVGIASASSKGGRIFTTESNAKGGNGSMTNTGWPRKHRKYVVTADISRGRGGADSMSAVSKLEESTAFPIPQDVGTRGTNEIATKRGRGRSRTVGTTSVNSSCQRMNPPKNNYEQGKRSRPSKHVVLSGNATGEGTGNRAGKRKAGPIPPPQEGLDGTGSRMKSGKRKTGGLRKDVGNPAEMEEDGASGGGVELQLGQTGDVVRSADAPQVLDGGHHVDMNTGDKRMPTLIRKETSISFGSSSAQDMPAERRGRRRPQKIDGVVASKRSAKESRTSIRKKKRIACGVS